MYDTIRMFIITSDYFPCWQVDLNEINTEGYFDKHPRFQGIGNTQGQQFSYFETLENLGMALKPRLANTPVIDPNGYCTALLADITYLEDGESEYSGEQFLFNFIAPGVQRQINLKLWTGVKINPDRYQINGSKSKEFNKLTRLCLALGLISESDLKGIKTESDLEKLAIGEKLEALKGQEVRFKLLKAAKGKGLSQIDLDTLQLVKAEITEKTKD